MTQPLFLIGARGSGKTTVGQALAKYLDYSFIDTDKYLQTHTGKNIAEIVAEEGWGGFRLREEKSLLAVAEPKRVIATGGGIVLSERNRHFMQENGIVIWLNVPASTLVMRLEADPEAEQRPSLTGKSIEDEVADVLAAREVLYQQTAHHIIDASESPNSIIEQILQKLGSRL